MKNTILASVVAILCTAAICVTCAVKIPTTKADSDPVAAAAADSAYMTEDEAAAYIGVNGDEMKMMRESLKLLEGSYMTYYYTGADGKEAVSYVYNRDALDDVMEKLMKSDKNKLNFKYLQEVLNKAEAAK